MRFDGEAVRLVGGPPVGDGGSQMFGVDDGLLMVFSLLLTDRCRSLLVMRGTP
jgi:hypothetical protein